MTVKYKSQEKVMKTKLNRILITKCARKANPKAIESTASPASTIPHRRLMQITYLYSFYNVLTEIRYSVVSIWDENHCTTWSKTIQKIFINPLVPQFRSVMKLIYIPLTSGTN